jgi:acetolactate synthase-1/3 small subunit
MIHTFAVYVDNKPGVLNRVASLFRRRAFNIESLTVGRTDQPGISRMTVVVETDEYGARRLEANLYKLVPVRRVENIGLGPNISRDLALIKVSAAGDVRAQVMQLVEVYRARVVDVGPESLVIETTGTEDKIESLVEVLRPYGVIEMARTGRVSMARGPAGARADLQDRSRAEDAARGGPNGRVASVDVSGGSV